MPSPNQTGRRAGVPNIKDEELTFFLNLVEEELPLGPAKWERVGTLYNAWAERNNFPTRNLKTLRKKFQALVRKGISKPTGDPTLPPLVRKAKQVFRALGNIAASETVDDAMSSDDDETERVLDANERNIELEGTDSKQRTGNYSLMYCLFYGKKNLHEIQMIVRT